MIRLIRRRILQWIARCGIVRLRGGGESRDIWRVGPLAVKRWGRNRKPADVRAVCRASRSHPDFASQWYVPWFHWSIRKWLDGDWAQYATLQGLCHRHPWAGDWKPENVIATARGPKIIDFQLLRPP